ncbi:MAG: hypothetical protein R3350_00760 [Saprospiraceae bacterium]|nr:hypothetical protein [Saprospiraceae bacterium]
MLYRVVIAVVIISLAACQSEDRNNWRPYDLLPHGIPITILAPDSVKVQKVDLAGILNDVTLRGGEDYYIQIYASEAETNDLAKVKAQQLAEVKSNRYFSSIVSEDEDGFVYQTQIDSNTVNYGFRHIRLQGDMEYIFQTGLVGSFTREEAERMYEAVQPEGQ